MSKFICAMIFAVCFLFIPSTYAAITCSVPTSTGFSTTYDSTAATINVTQGTVTFTCTRGAAGDNTSIRLRASVAAQNTAASGANTINYEAYQDSGCATVWSNDSNPTAITITLASVLTAQPFSVNYWGCVPALQAPVAGTYTDTVTMTLRSTTGPPATYNTGSFPVSIVVPGSCAISTPPLDLNIAYTSFQAGPATGTTSIGVTCNAGTAYTMAVDIPSGTLAGIAYAITLPASSTGTGATQTHTITGTAVAGQSGTCGTGSCVGTQLTTLTISY